MKTKSLMFAPIVCFAAFLCAGTATAATILGQGGTLTLDGGFGGFIQLDGGPGQIIASPIFSSVVIASGQTEVGCICAAFGTNI
jgi:hypothetical protein